MPVTPLPTRIRPPRGESARPAAYPVPFAVTRPGDGRLQLVNRSQERLESVVLLLHGPGLLDVQHLGSLDPGGAMRARVRGERLEVATSVVVRWFRPGGEEYLWRVAF